MIGAISRENNFDLIRLIAALQVAVHHTLVHLQVPEFQLKLCVGGGRINIEFPFPGVIVFFAISGFLVTASLDRNQSVKKYILNRILRIVPALYLAFILTFIALACFGFINVKTFSSIPFLGWIIGQLTLFQFFTPDILRPYGVGCPNGSLWTIPVEFVFYLCLPLIIFFFRKRKNIGLIIFSVLSIVSNVILCRYGGDGLIAKFIGVTVLPYLYIFLLGSLLYYNWSLVKSFFEGKALIYILIYILYASFIAKPSYDITSMPVLFANILLCLLTISLAYTLPKIAKVLHGFDISYGLYVYHMIVVNIFVQLGLVGKIKYAIIALAISICLGILSWQLLESKVLKLKNKVRI